MKRAILLLIFLCLLHVSAAAATKYVATSGNDTTGDGTVGNPYRTIDKAISVIAGGDTVIIRGGTYNETIGITRNISSGASFAAATVIRAEIGEVVTILPTGSPPRVLNLDGGETFVVFQDLIFDGINTGANSVVKITDGSNRIRLLRCEIKNAPQGMGILITNGSGVSSHNEILSCNVHHNGTGGDPGSGPPHGIYISTHHNLVEGNHIHDNPNGYGLHLFDGDPDDNIFRGNRFANNLDGGILDGDRNQFINNIVYGHGIGLRIGTGSSPVNDDEIYNNTFYANGLDIMVAFADSATSTKVRAVQIKNNIFYSTASPQLVLKPDAEDCVVTNNRTRTSITNSGVNNTLTANTTGDPSFVDAGNTNFHLQSSSTARDAGVNLTGEGVTSDLDGVSRPQGPVFDLGAFEFVTGGGVTPRTLAGSRSQVSRSNVASPRSGVSSRSSVP